MTFFHDSFPILRTGTRTKLQNTVFIVVASACIMNFITLQNEPHLEENEFEDDDLEDPEIDLEAGQRAENSAGSRIAGNQFRDWIVENFCSV